MTRLSSLAFVAALLLSACSVELGGQGDVTADGGSIAPHDDVPSGAKPGMQDVAPRGDAASNTPPGSSDDAGAAGIGSALDAGAGPSPSSVDAEVDATRAVEDAARPVQPSTPATPDASAADAAIKPVDPPVIDPPKPFVLTSPAFAAGAKIPSVHTCNGEDLSPAFVWQGAPAGTKSFAMVLTTHTNWFNNIVDWQRWVMWNIPATRTGLPASIEEGHTPSDVPGAIQASNESETQGDWATGASVGPGGSAGPGGGFPGGGGTPGGGGSAGGGSSDDDRKGRRYRGPCSYGRPQTFEFTLFALGAGPPAPEWRLGITTDEIVAWLERDANVLGKAVLDGVAP